MPDTIKDGTGNGFKAKVGGDNRLWTNAIVEKTGSNKSLEGGLFIFGGSFTLTGSESNAPMLWLRNDDREHMIRIDKIIFGWNGGSTNHNRTNLCTVSYEVSEPTANATSIGPQIENIARSGFNAPVTDNLTTAHKWDGVGSSGMTGGANGYQQVEYRISQGSTNFSDINGQVILGQSDTMQIGVTPEEAGLFSCYVIYWKYPGKGDV